MQNELGGPKTEQGKARSSQNALKHGLTSRKLFLLQHENPEHWKQLLADFSEEFQPANSSRTGWSKKWPSPTGACSGPGSPKTLFSIGNGRSRRRIRKEIRS